MFRMVKDYDLDILEQLL